MALIEQINDDLKEALKAGDSFTVEVLRGVNAVFKNKSIEKRGKGLEEELKEEEVLEILGREVKKRKEAIDLYLQGGRSELAEKENKEIELIQKYLPKQLSREEVEKVVEEVINRAESKDFAVVMKEAMGELKGKADGKIVSEVVREKLS